MKDENCVTDFLNGLWLFSVLKCYVLRILQPQVNIEMVSKHELNQDIWYLRIALTSIKKSQFLKF